MADASQVLEWRGQQLVDPEGGKLGKIEEIFLDADTNQPEWLAVKTGMFGSNLTFVPIAEASDQGGSVQPYDKAQIKDAPNELSQDEEARLYQHYGLEYGESHSDTGLPQGQRGREGSARGDTGTVGRDVSGPETDDAMTRSEEELRVGTAQRETGRARLRKYIVTEDVQQTVPVRREEVRVEREPITDANVDEAVSGPEISEQEHEVTLHEEQPVVEKTTVPKERIRSVGEQLRAQGKDGPAKLADQAAERTERLGGYLSQSDADRILGDVEDLARRQPWAVVAGGIALGFAASRFFKASSSECYRSSLGESGAGRRQIPARAQDGNGPSPRPVGTVGTGMPPGTPGAV
jgi:uncharacterized protein (TIGR02271 family)